MYFPVSGVDVALYIPVTVAFVVSFFTSMGGVSGAFILLPFQISVLGFSSPSVSPTNLVYNIVAIPSGVYRYIREGRMAWPLATIIVAGTLPGVFIGVFLRIRYLPDPTHFKIFVGCVLLYIAARLLYELRTNAPGRNSGTTDLEDRFRGDTSRPRRGPALNAAGPVGIRTIKFSLTEYAFTFYGETFSFNPLVLFLITFVVGIIGGTYGIGGGALVAPFLVTVFGLPIYTVSGATLLGTFMTSVSGIVFYTVVAPFYAHTGLSIMPDWRLGMLFGLGGFLGIYCGARCQRHFPARIIKLILGLAILFLSIRYLKSVFAIL